MGKRGDSCGWEGGEIQFVFQEGLVAGWGFTTCRGNFRTFSHES